MKIIFDIDAKDYERAQLKRAVEDGDMTWIEEMIGGLRIENAEIIEDEEPKSYWYITSIGEIVFRGFALKKFNKGDESRKEIGNYFETKEDAEKAIEKLKTHKICNYYSERTTSEIKK